MAVEEFWVLGWRLGLIRQRGGRMQVIAVGRQRRDRAKRAKQRGHARENRGDRRQNRHRDGGNSGLQSTSVRWGALIGLTLVALNWMLWGRDC